MASGARTILTRFFERLFPYVPRFPVIAIGFEGDVPLESSGRGVPTGDWPIGSRWTQIDPAVAGDILWVKRATGVAGWAKLGTILNEAQDAAIAAAAAAAAAAQATANGAVTVNTTQTSQITALQAADTAHDTAIASAASAAATASTAAGAAQDTADEVRTDFDDLSALIGDIGTVVGPGAPPGYPADLTAGFVTIITDMNGKLATSRLRGGSVIITAASTSATFDLANGWGTKPVVAGPAGNPGLATKWWANVSGGIVTVSVDIAPGADKVFWFIAADVS